MSETTIQEIQRLMEASASAFERGLFGAILALDAAASATPAADDDQGDLVACAQCEEIWPAEDLHTEARVCPNCIITNYYEERRHPAPALQVGDERAQLLANIARMWPSANPHLPLATELRASFGKSSLEDLTDDQLRRLHLSVAL